MSVSIILPPPLPCAICLLYLVFLCNFPPFIQFLFFPPPFQLPPPRPGFYFHWNLRAAESLQSLRPYISKLRHLNAKMRAILLDWVTDVHQSLSFAPATLYRTAQVLDQVSRGKKEVGGNFS